MQASVVGHNEKSRLGLNATEGFATAAAVYAGAEEEVYMIAVQLDLQCS